MSKLETAILALVGVFEEYAGKDGDKKNLSTEELKALLTSQLSSPALKDKYDPETINEAMKKMDKNHDQQVSFKEFCMGVVQLSCHYYRKKCGKDKEGCKGKH